MGRRTQPSYPRRTAFFPAVVAPTVFKSLPEAEAGHFLRALFPRYYLFLIIGSAAAALAHGRAAPEPALLAAAVAVSTAAVLLLSVPKINALRDRQLAGDDAAAELLIEPTAYP